MNCNCNHCSELNKARAELEIWYQESKPKNEALCARVEQLESILKAYGLKVPD